MSRVLILGANSAIAQAVARLYAAGGSDLILVSRSRAKLDQVVADIKLRSTGKVASRVADLTATQQHQDIISEAVQTLGGLDIVLIAFGELGDHAEAARSFPVARTIFETNLLAPISLLTQLTPVFEQQRSGTIAVITSVAGMRGRQTNYVYASAKGGLSVYLSGLRQRLHVAGVQVLDLKIGFVDTPMTQKVEKKGILWAKPDSVAPAIIRAIACRRDIALIPWIWCLIMGIVCAIPERIFKRLKL